ncbi:MAG TPA: trypsin-like peptidase domain-containing protein [Polyangia bacterium]|nr:trypsin-like peptidase domain-containing protein [Polyangia bacterium]
MVPAAELTPKVEPVPEAHALSRAFTTAAKAIRPSVVRIDVETAFQGPSPSAQDGEPDSRDFMRRFFNFDFDGDQSPFNNNQAPFQRSHGTGSGVIINGAGDILTNNHVVKDATKVTIQLADGRSFPGKVVGTDPMTDVGVVRFENAVPNLTAARLGNSDELEIGEWVIAVGSPLGMEQTVTVGVVSGVGATGRHFRFESGERVRKYIETDAKINPGNSGGPLVNLSGEVVGINTLINVGPGGSYGFAIPINQAFEVATVLLKGGRMRYPYIGVSVVGITDVPRDELEKAGAQGLKAGALVSAVTPGSPAAQAGIQPGDVIVEIGGERIETGDEVVARVSEHKIGDTLSVSLMRGGKERTVSVKVGEFPNPALTAMTERRIGVALQTLTPELADSLGLEPAVRGAVVTDVEAKSPAEHAGLVPGDVILEVDRKPVATADEAAQALRAGGGAHLLRVTSAKGTRFVSVGPSS